MPRTNRAYLILSVRLAEKFLVPAILAAATARLVELSLFFPHERLNVRHVLPSSRNLARYGILYHCCNEYEGWRRNRAITTATRWRTTNQMIHTPRRTGRDWGHATVARCVMGALPTWPHLGRRWFPKSPARLTNRIKIKIACCFSSEKRTSALLRPREYTNE